MGKYLDKTGLSAFWQKIKDTFAKKSDIPVANPTLDGSEEKLTGVAFGETKYAIPEGLPYIKSVEITYGTNIGDLAVLLSGSSHFYGIAKFTGLFNGHYICDLNVSGGISYITDTKTGVVYSNLSNNINSMLIHVLLTDQYIVNKLKSVKYIDGYTGGDGSLSAKLKWLVSSGHVTATNDEFIFDSYYWSVSPIYSSNVQIQIKSLNSDSWYAFYDATNNTDLINVDNISNISLNTKQKNLLINPTLDGTESELTAIQYNGTNYKISSGGGVSGDYLPLDGGHMNGDIEFPNDQGLINDENPTGFGFNDCGEPTILNGYGRYICIATDYFAGEYTYYNFPDEGGTVALTSDIPHQHDIHFMSGTGIAANVYIWFTLNITDTSAFTTAAAVASALYNRGNTERRNAVSATGRANNSSGSFAGSIVGVYAPNVNTIGVVYMNSTGTIGTVEYATSLLTSMRDKVN